MNLIIERVVSQTIDKYIAENCKPSIINENDGDNMGVYTELDNEVYQICYTHGFNVNTHVNKDGVYCAIFNADGNDPRIQEAIGLLKKLGLRKREGGPLSGYVHYFTIDFH